LIIEHYIELESQEYFEGELEVNESYFVEDTAKEKEANEQVVRPLYLGY